jgi:hypothetical protein
MAFCNEWIWQRKILFILVFLVSRLSFQSARVILDSSENLQKLDLAKFHGFTKHGTNVGNQIIL